MEQQEIHQFLEHFFHATHCVIEKQTESYMIVQLTEEMDKAIMNRPFYWHYIEKVGIEARPAKLTLITDFTVDPKKLRGEWIHYGSPRLHQFFTYARKEGSFIRLYENKKGGRDAHSPLIPWLCLNIKISYECDRKKDKFRSIGLNLINGLLVESFHDIVKELALVPKIPDYAYTLSPLIMPKSGIRRIERLIKNGLEAENHQWAIDAIKRWQQDEQLLDQFYLDADEKPDRYFIEKEALKEQFEPKITVSIINGGLFYLTNESILKTKRTDP